MAPRFCPGLLMVIVTAFAACAPNPPPVVTPTAAALATPSPAPTAAAPATPLPSPTPTAAAPTPTAPPAAPATPSPAPTAPPATPVASAPSSSPAASATIEVSWHQVTGSPVDRIRQGLRAAWTGERFVVAATVLNPATGGARGTGFWTSPDGTTWSLDDTPSAGWVTDFAFDGTGGGTAVGFLNQSAAAWTSSDGIRWTRVPEQPALRPSASASARLLRHVAYGAGGYVAIGVERLESDRSVLLTSKDGATWTQSAPAGLLSGNSLDDIASTGGRYVLTGHTRGPYRSRLWSSEDGRTWTENAPPAGADPTKIEGDFSIVAGDAGWVLLRSGYQSSQAAWWSPDGLAWSLRTTPNTNLASLWNGSLIAAPFGVVARAFDGPGTTQLWVSRDAASWARLLDYPGNPPSSFIAAASGVAIVTVDQDAKLFVGSFQP